MTCKIEMEPSIPWSSLHSRKFSAPYNFFKKVSDPSQKNKKNKGNLGLIQVFRKPKKGQNQVIKSEPCSTTESTFTIQTHLYGMVQSIGKSGGFSKIIEAFGGEQRLGKVANWLQRMRKLTNGNVYIVSTSWFPVSAEQWKFFIGHVSHLLRIVIVGGVISGFSIFCLAFQFIITPPI